ncbi:hypothetical protein VSR34_33450 [Paraburkholderia sp. JHI2823]|uniref:hypothetical protein n=1 Tax=Paraburkholderia TaxID=1822464 RepID=UPI0012B60DEC|nr:hypothetical protein [Paraburkholderia mimosarum]
MKVLALLLVLAVVAPLANAEQGDAEDRALTAQMTRDAQTAPPLANSGYGDVGKANVESGLPKSKESNDTTDTGSGQ